MKIFNQYTICAFALLMIISSFEGVHDDTSKLYVIALKEHILKIEKNITSQSERQEFAHKPIFVINEQLVELPKELGNHKLQELGDSASSFIKGQDGFHAIKLNPIGVYEGNVVVTLSDYRVTKNDKEAIFSYVGGMEYVFSYNSKSRRYGIVRTQSISF